MLGAKCRIFKNPTLILFFKADIVSSESVGPSLNPTQKHLLLHDSFCVGTGAGLDTNWIREEHWMNLKFHICMELLCSGSFLCLPRPLVGLIFIVIFNLEFVSIFSAYDLPSQFSMALSLEPINFG